MERKRLLLVLSACLITLIAVLAVMAGCGGTSTVTSTVTGTVTQTSTTQVQVVTLSMAPGGLPNADALFGGIPEWQSEIEKRTEGRVKVDVYYGETLAKGRENVDAMDTGLADIIFAAPQYTPGKTPLFTIANVPGLTNDYWAKAMAFYELLTTEQPMIDEFGQYGGVIIGAAYYPPVGLISKNAITSLDQLNGMKISAMSPSSELLVKFGAAPLSLAPPEQYEALMRGTVDAIAAPVAAIIDFKFYEVGKNFTTFNLGDRNHALVISKNALAKLTPQDQQIIKDFAPEYTQIAYDATATGLEPKGTDTLKQNGVQFTAPNANDAARLLTAAQELQDTWVNDMNGQGLPGTEIMAKFKELIAKYEAQSPYKDLVK